MIKNQRERSRRGWACPPIGLKSVFWLLTAALSPLAASNRNPVIVVSFDGFRHDYVDYVRTPEFDRMAAEGFRARMIPAYPSLTFPNHFTLVTGMRPFRHGVVSNTMYDRRLDLEFDKTQRGSIDEPIWYEASPIWEAVTEAGLKSAVFFWFSSEVKGRTPTWFMPFNHSLPHEARFERLTQWLDPENEPTPHIMFFYFPLLDHAGHAFGPHSPELLHATATADWLVGRFRQVIEESGRDVDFLIVSDHGMTPLNTSWLPISEVEDALGSDLKRLVNSYSQVDLFLENPGSETVGRALAALPQRHYLKWFAADVFPHGAHPDRNGDVIGIMDPGYEFRECGEGRMKGGHGYHQEHPDMAAAAFGVGPSFISGQILDRVRSVDVYPLLLHLLGLSQRPVDGTLEAWNPILTVRADNGE